MILSWKEIITLILLMPSLNLSGCRNGNTGKEAAVTATEKNYNPLGYDLSNPDRTFVLPGILYEISGITEIDSSTVACIQDENGVLFIYDLLKGMISKHYFFNNDGDYEGIARVGKTIFVLRSDGIIFEIPDYEAGEFTRIAHRTGIPAADNEGLCHDNYNNRLLIAPKSNIIDAKKSKRAIYGFNLKKRKLLEKPVIKFDMSDIRKFAIKNKIDLPMTGKKDKKEPVIELRASAIGIHPLTKKLYLISGVEKLLFVFDMEGTIEYMEKLDSDLFRQPEGITFLGNGDMLISNEGRGDRATILRFNLNVE